MAPALRMTRSVVFPYPQKTYRSILTHMTDQREATVFFLRFPPVRVTSGAYIFLVLLLLMPLLFPSLHNHAFYIRVAVVQSSAYSRPDLYLASLLNACETLQSAVSLYTSIYYMYDFEVASLQPALLTSLRRGHSASHITTVMHFFNQIQTSSQDPKKIELQPSRQIACSTGPCRGLLDAEHTACQRLDRSTLALISQVECARTLSV